MKNKNIKNSNYLIKGSMRMLMSSVIVTGILGVSQLSASELVLQEQEREPVAFLNRIEHVADTSVDLSNKLIVVIDKTADTSIKLSDVLVNTSNKLTDTSINLSNNLNGLLGTGMHNSNFHCTLF